jgi:hypothetical protein
VAYFKPWFDSIQIYDDDDRWLILVFLYKSSIV